MNRPSRPACGVLRAAILLGALLVLGAGCSGRRIAVPALSPDHASQEALAQFDSNKDGFLDAKELAPCPALRSALPAMDTNRDGRLSADEIAKRLATYEDSKIGRMPVSCQVLLNGKPLADATVTFVPCQFLGAEFKSASGVSDARGMVQLKEDGADSPGVACGLFNVEVSKKSGAGQETLPPRYNAQTVLGQEVAPDSSRGLVRLQLKSP